MNEKKAKKFYYLTAVPAKHCLGANSPRCKLASATCYNKKTIISLLKERQKEFPEYLFTIGFGWRGNKNCMGEILKMDKLFK